MATIMRDPTQQYELPADHAAMRMHAFTIEGRALIPALVMAMTKGELFAFSEPETRPAALGSTIIPMRSAPRI
jgi:hypothetical protein